MAKLLLGSQVQEWCLSVGFDPQSTYGSSNYRIAVHFSNFTNTDYLSRMFSVVQQQLRDNIVALQDVLPYVTATLTSVTYLNSPPDADKNIKYPHLYEELIHFV